MKSRRTLNVINLLTPEEIKMTNKLTRNEVYTRLDSEREYQDNRWVGPDGPHVHTPTEWLVYIQDYLTEAIRFSSREDAITADVKVMDSLRKIAGMCVAAAEQNGMNFRK